MNWERHSELLKSLQKVYRLPLVSEPRPRVFENHDVRWCMRSLLMM